MILLVRTCARLINARMHAKWLLINSRHGAASSANSTPQTTCRIIERSTKNPQSAMTSEFVEARFNEAKKKRSPNHRSKRYVSPVLQNFMIIPLFLRPFSMA